MHSSRQPAAIDYEVRARNVSGAVASEEYRCVGNVLRLAQPRPRCTASGVLNQGRVLSNARASGLDLAGRYGVADDEILGVVTRDLASDVDGTGLADSVRRL